MSCPVWSELNRAGDELLREGSKVRLRAEKHFTECACCADRAYLLDPSWAVRRLGPVEFSGDEAADLGRSILEGARLRRIDREVASRPPESSRSTLRQRAGMVAAGGALLFAAASGLVLRPSGGEKSAESLIQGTQVDVFAPVVKPRTQQWLPRIGELTPAEARVYELGQKEFALVMVVHETLDL